MKIFLLIPKPWYTIMKITLSQFFIAILLTSLSYANSGKAQGMLQKPVTLVVNNSSLSTVLKQLEKQAGVKFVYSKSLVKIDKTVSVNAAQQPLNEVLDHVLDGSGIAYEIVNDRIVLTQVKTAESEQLIIDQAFPVSGNVVDETGAPLPGVTVRLNNSTQGTTTDANGAFTLNVNGETDVLSFSFIGYETQTVTVGANRTFNIQLKTGQAKALQEVVVVGYGTSRRETLSTSVSSVKGDVIRERPTSIDIAQSLQGRAPGVNVMINSGKPGGAPAVKIRGLGSIYTSSDPLWVVDGFVGVDPRTIDPNIVESMDILKDAAATAIYGARGSNGVIIVTTRKGKTGESRITFNNTLSFGSVMHKPDLLNATERLKVFEAQYNYNPNDALVAPHLPNGENFAHKADLFNADGSPKYNTDWIDESTRLAVSNNHSLSFIGGTDKLKVTANLNYRNNEGVLLNSYEKRVSGFLKLSWNVKPWLDIDAEINSGGSQGNNVDLDPMGSTAIRKMYEFLPFLPVTYPDGTYSHMGDYPRSENSENPVRLFNEIQNTVGSTYSTANFVGKFHLTKDLDLVTQLGGFTQSLYDFYYAGRELVSVSAPLGRARRRHDNLGRWTNENYLDYKHLFGKHNLNVTAGVSWYYQRSTYTSAQATNFFDDFYSYNNIGAGSDRPTVASDWLQEQTNSFYGRVQYSYDDRYLATASYRVDGASQVAEGQKYGSFPSFSLGWNVHNESFFKEGSLANTINQLKIRGSWGITGNALLPTFASLPLIGTAQYPFGNTPVTVTTPQSLGNPILGWEEAVQYNIGFELGLFKNRLNVVFDYYNKENRDLLLRKTLPYETGYPPAYDNIGQIRNRGIEVAVTSVNITSKDFSWNTTATFTMNRSKVLKLNGAPIFDTWAGWIAEGRPLNEFYGYVRQGVWGTNEAAEAAKYGKLPGDTKWQDTNHNGVKDIEDRVPLGNAMPKWEASLSNRFSYKGVSLLIDLGGMYGLSLINSSRHLMQASTSNVNSYGPMLDAWTPQNQNTNIPAVRLPSDALNPSEVADSYAVEDASFIRVRNIGLSYTTSAPWLKKVLLNSLTIGANVENAFLWTKYSGFDPEYTSLDSKLNQGVDIYQYPKPRVISFSLNASF